MGKLTDPWHFYWVMGINIRRKLGLSGANLTFEEIDDMCTELSIEMDLYLAGDDLDITILHLQEIPATWSPERQSAMRLKYEEHTKAVQEWYGAVSSYKVTETSDTVNKPRFRAEVVSALKRLRQIEFDIRSSLAQHGPTA